MKQKENNREKRNVRMRVKLLGAVFFILHSSFFISPSSAQTFENRFTRSLSDVFEDVQKQFGIRLKYDIDTTGLKLPYADFRIRAYSVEETLKNLCAPFDFVPWDQGKGLWKIKRFEYPRRKPEDGKCDKGGKSAIICKDNILRTVICGEGEYCVGEGASVKCSPEG